MSEKDKRAWILACGIILVGLLAVPWLRTPRAAEEQLLRAQFQLPADVAFADSKVERPSIKKNAYNLEGIARFDAEQFGQYRKTISVGAPWTIAPLSLEGVAFPGQPGTDTIRWRSQAEHQFMSFGNLSEDEVWQATRGLTLCYKVMASPSADAPPSDRVRPCRPGGNVTERGYLVQGLLDPDTRTLHILVRRIGRWPLPY
ncbi:MAG: hypothetical protein NBV68_02490 [Erythrobacter sp.]|uniref:hypothetical protein n=1 Tax=Erythrobacter sp. TaxID=1042 RepID=UPI0025F50C9A|nr:hypothetical protein [Erythrobacter sp.]MCL9998225.1 hypothetical protein [Erythrobacter sp.]